MRPDRALMITGALAALSLIGSAASVYSAWSMGEQPSWAHKAAIGFAALFVLLGALLVHFLWPVLRTNPRQVPLVTAVRRVGLIDVESRNEGDRHLPPEAIYTLPKLRELVISGINAASSFRNHMELIKGLLRRKADVYFLICSEETEGLHRISDIERRNVIAEIQEVRDAIEMEHLLDDQHFQIKVFSQLPSFTAVMVNGDIAPRQSTPQDNEGFIRIQPRRMVSTHHDGIVLQFGNTRNPLDGFNLFASDLRAQWLVARRWERNRAPSVSPSSTSPEPEIAGVYEPGDEYKFYKELKTLVGFATRALLIIDNYLDTELFDVYMENAHRGLPTRVLTNQVRGSLKTVAEKFSRQGNFELRSSDDVHDRVIFADDRCWVIGQSIKDAAKKKPTYIVEHSRPLTMRTIYERIWTNASSIVKT